VPSTSWRKSPLCEPRLAKLFQTHEKAPIDHPVRGCQKQLPRTNPTQIRINTVCTRSRLDRATSVSIASLAAFANAVIASIARVVDSNQASAPLG
jgi:hypothetical protein